ncbi:hypothetical protein L2E82_51732 [Cichorium intybus]|nr:hypothetical protein L2E82_51732 [Cichorium intybus]
MCSVRTESNRIVEEEVFLNLNDWLVAYFRLIKGENGAIVRVHDDEIQSDSCSSNRNSISLPEELEGLHEKYSSSCRLFKYQKLVAATKNFKLENMIGKGGNSHVYRGCLPDGRELAVKILKTSDDVLKEFMLEIEIIAALHHENIISLFGFCFEDTNDLLSRGSLEDNLHGMSVFMLLAFNLFVHIWVCESEYGEDEGNCEFAFLIFPINEHNRARGLVPFRSNSFRLGKQRCGPPGMMQHISGDKVKDRFQGENLDTQKK